MNVLEKQSQKRGSQKRGRLHSVRTEKHYSGNVSKPGRLIQGIQMIKAQWTKMWSIWVSQKKEVFNLEPKMSMRYT